MEHFVNKELFKHYNEAFESIYIHPESMDSKVAINLRSLFPKKIKDFDSRKKIRAQTLSPEDFDQSKKEILVMPYKGKFFKQCPGGNQNSACCNYFVLNLGSQCHFNCSYCYLQSFLNSPFMVIYSNIDEARFELSKVAKSMKDHRIRVGTGETIDSLGLDPLTNYTSELVKALKDNSNIQLELKTKSNFVDHLLDMNHYNQVTVSWSVNPEEVVESEEHETATLDQRLEAARKVLDKNFSVAFHIDPVIWHPDWEKNYKRLVKRICSSFKPNEVPYVSLGALRFQTEQAQIMKERFSRTSFVNSGEMFVSKDKKLRYDSRLRSKMFKTIIDEFKSYSRSWRVFLCMESPETWLQTYGDSPRRVEGLDELFVPKPLVNTETL